MSLLLMVVVLLFGVGIVLDLLILELFFVLGVVCLFRASAGGAINN